MTDYGLTSAGFVPKTLADLKLELEGSFQAEWGANTRIDAESVNGQLIGIMAERLSLLWDLAELVHVSAFPGGASGAALDDLAALAEVERNPATYSTVTLQLTGTAATLIPAGSQSKDPDTGELWTHDDPTTLSGGGTGTVTATATRTGPVLGLAGTITAIATPIGGWTGVTNAADATIGADVQSDASLRADLLVGFRAGSGGVEAIRAALLRLDGVTEALVIENPDIEPDEDGRPGKSFEAVVRGGDDQEIADTIWAIKDAGIETYGSSSETVIDSAGDSHTVEFSRPTLVDIYFDADLDVSPGFPSDGEDLIKESMVAYGQTFTIGQDVVPFKFIQRIELDNIEDFDIRAGTAPSPTSQAPVIIGRTQLAVITSPNITITRI